MMEQNENTSLERTVQCFLAAIEAQSQEEVQALEDSVAAQNQEKEQAVRRKAQEQGELARLSGVAQVQNAGMLTVSARRAGNKRKLLACRLACEKQAVAELTERVRAYVEGPEYPARLAELLDKGLKALDAGNGPAVVYLRREDMAQAETLRKKQKGVSLTVQEGDFALGGLMVALPGRGQRADLTFDTGLRQAQERFGEIAGLEIS
jgi:vacuolar-type H+-ATPase subunit E/Vma4